MEPDVSIMALLLLFVHSSGSDVQEGTNSTVSAISSAKHHGGGDRFSDDCANDNDCSPFQVCIYGSCYCDRGYYPYENICKRCPGYAEYCGLSKCCSDPTRYYCSGDICRCKIADGEICGAPSQPHNIRGFQMMTVFQVILASAFSIALLALLVQCWRTCCRKKLSPRRPATRPNSRPPVVTREEIAVSRASQEATPVMRDAPPKYDDLNHVQFEKPPAYQEVVNTDTYFQEGRQFDERLAHVYATAPTDACSGGVENAAFTTDDYRNLPMSPSINYALENRNFSSQAVTDHRPNCEDQHIVRSEVVDTGPNNNVVILAAAALINQQSTSQSDSKSEQENLPAAPSDSVVVCQVHRNGTPI